MRLARLALLAAMGCAPLLANAGTVTVLTSFPKELTTAYQKAFEAKKRGVEPAQVGRADWLEPRREELVDRMHARRSRDGGEFGIGYGSSSGYGKPTYSRAWRPSLFRFR